MWNLRYRRDPSARLKLPSRRGNQRDDAGQKHRRHLPDLIRLTGPAAREKAQRTVCTGVVAVPMPPARRLRNWASSLLTVLGAARPRPRSPGLLPRRLPPVISHGGRGQELSPNSVCRALMPLMSHLPRATPPNTLAHGVRFRHRSCGSSHQVESKSLLEADANGRHPQHQPELRKAGDRLWGEGAPRFQCWQPGAPCGRARNWREPAAPGRDSHGLHTRTWVVTKQAPPPPLHTGPVVVVDVCQHGEAPTHA